MIAPMARPPEIPPAPKSPGRSLPEEKVLGPDPVRSPEGLTRGEALPELLRPTTPASLPGQPASQGAHIARQILTATRQMPDGQTELRLEPEELGRVTLRLRTEDGAVMLHLTAERAETSDLMRRHISQLEQSYRNLGYARVEISVNGQQTGQGQGGWQGQGAWQGQGQSPGHSGQPSAPPEPREAAEPHRDTPPPATVPDKIDIRL
ncbi:hypothetical protein GR170_19755 [Pseudooceanicola sp. GBMRC 2024]|uniref:Flagellar hook-length control protein-like C-terminal domain-containing protein n=2 Tax=Paracoccaceae TaxID=31989 RepID=A0A6L7G9J3_9RHOB|nr:hypothetical protein [Pseudooceanicola albus]